MNILSLIVLIAAIAITFCVTYFITKSKNYSKGFNDAKQCTTIPDVIYDSGNIIHKGLDPRLGITILEKEHPFDENINIPEFGVDIKYNSNNEHPLERTFDITAFCKYTNPKFNQILITPNGVSDGYHTFDELYQYRLIYNAALINMLSKFKVAGIDCIKSKRHNDNQKCFDGNWFIVMIKTPWGQISNHYELKYWNMFACRVAKRAWKWDGHTPQEAYERLIKLIKHLS